MQLIVERVGLLKSFVSFFDSTPRKNVYMTPTPPSIPQRSLPDLRISALSLVVALLPLVLAGWSAFAFAQNPPAPVPVPGAGQVLKQLEPLGAPASLGAPGVPLSIEPAAATPANAAHLAKSIAQHKAGKAAQRELVNPE